MTHSLFAHLVAALFWLPVAWGVLRLKWKWEDRK